MSVVEDVKVVEVSETAILGVSGNENMLINASSQEDAISQTSVSGGKMSVIVQGLQLIVYRRDIPQGGFRPAVFSDGDVNYDGTEFYVLQQFINMDKET